jgi:hypothetical protein
MPPATGRRSRRRRRAGPSDADLAEARSVPSTRARIFANAVSREVDVSSPNGEKPQSSVVPRWAGSMKRAAWSTRINPLPFLAVMVFGANGL